MGSIFTFWCRRRGSICSVREAVGADQGVLDLIRDSACPDHRRGEVNYQLNSTDLALFASFCGENTPLATKLLATWLTRVAGGVDRQQRSGGHRAGAATPRVCPVIAAALSRVARALSRGAVQP